MSLHLGKVCHFGWTENFHLKISRDFGGVEVLPSSNEDSDGNESVAV